MSFPGPALALALLSTPSIGPTIGPTTGPSGAAEAPTLRPPDMGRPATTLERPAIHAIVVAHNRSADGSLPPLRYADDDGARWVELLGLQAEEVTLLSVLDEETQALHPEAARAARVPSRAELFAALDRTFRALAALRGAGRRSVLFFVYVGHGTVGPDGAGHMHLADGTLGRSELFERVIGRSPATVNHVIVDACHAYLMVSKRGAADATAVDRAVAGFLARESLERYPNTGVLLSTSRSKEVHEWSGFRAGVFSHQVRSALSGAADVDGDGEVGYEEVRAFVAAANARVVHAEAKLEVFALPPALFLQAPLAARTRSRLGSTLRVPAELAGRWWLEDGRGVRYADFHAAPGEELRLSLVPQPTYFLKNEAQEIRIALGDRRTVDAGRFERQPTTLARRGSAERAFREDLFAIPFGRAWFEGFRAAELVSDVGVDLETEAPPAPGWSSRHWVASGLFVGAVGAAVAGGLLAVEAEATASQYRVAIGSTDQISALRDQANEQATLSRLLFGVAAGLVGGGILTLAW